MTSQIDETLLDSIVAGILDRLRGASAPNDAASGGRQSSENEARESTTTRRADAPSPIALEDRVVTEAILEAKLRGARVVRFSPKAVLTPSARDFLRINEIEWGYADTPKGMRQPSRERWAALVVRSTPAVERAVADVLPEARKELLGCPDDAASLAISEISRGGFSQAVVFVEQTHRTACLANRHKAVKAVAIRDAGDVKAVRKQLRANTWCLDPTGRSRFELTNLIRTIIHGASHQPSADARVGQA